MIKVPISSGMKAIHTKYEEHHGEIENIAGFLSNGATIGYLDSLDVAQEIRIKAFKLIEAGKVNETKGDLMSLLFSSSKNRITDISRKVVHSHNTPCRTCPFWDKCASKKSKHDCNAFDDKQECVKFFNFTKNAQKKKSLNTSPEMENNLDKELVHDGLNSPEHMELVEFLETLVPDFLKRDLALFTNNDFSFSGIRLENGDLLMSFLRKLYSEEEE